MAIKTSKKHVNGADVNYYIKRKSELPKDWRRIAVFDIDGVLVDVSERLRASIEEIGLDPKDVLKYGIININDKTTRRKFWRIFLSPKYMYLDKPRQTGIDLLGNARERGMYIVLLSGRVEELVSDTLKQLKEFGVEWDMLVMRQKGDYRKDAVFKYDFVKKHLHSSIRELHDDMASTVISIAEGFSKKIVSSSIVECVPEIRVYKVYRHVGNTWYNYPSYSVIIRSKERERIKHIFEFIDTGLKIRLKTKLDYPTDITWMWYTVNVKNEEEAEEQLSEIYQSIMLLENMGYISHEVSPEELHIGIVDNVEIIEINKNGETWRIPRIYPRPLIQFLKIS